MKVGEKVLYIGVIENQLVLESVTIKSITQAKSVGNPYDWDIIHVEEFDEYIDYTDIYTKAQILSFFR